jgi:protein-S-isoprenylcysteine O-methyltransferase Ste14
MQSSFILSFRAVADAIALLYSLLIFPAPIYWLAIHPAIHFWRRQGNRSFWIALPIWIGTGSALILLRRGVLAARQEQHLWMILPGLLLVGVAAWLDRATRRDFGIRRLVGIPEMNPFDPQAQVVSQGIYSRLRHPRYVQYCLTFWGLAFLTCRAWVFLLAILTVLLYLIVAPLEERELQEQYGEAYEKYAQQVPRFIPRLRRRNDPQVAP